MDFLKKIKYGLIRLKDELIGIDDYWHVRERSLKKEEINNNIYYLDMSLKASYPGKIKEGIPIYYLDGKYPIIFHNTTLNYGLGLLNEYSNGKNVKNILKKIVYFLLNEQDKSGSLKYQIPKESKHLLSGNKVSGMTQGLAISFMIRCYNINLVDKSQCTKFITLAKQRMLKKDIISVIDSKYKIIEEYYSPGSSILNGAIFALLGLYDYCKFIGNMKDFELYNNDLIKLLPKFNFFGWCKYDLKGTICSRFYQQLHVDLMDTMYLLTNNSEYKYYSNKWKNGLKFKSFFIFVKSVQKVSSLNKMIMSYTEKR